MGLITINLSYYNQSRDVLLMHINAWKKIPKSIRNFFIFNIIDDCSKTPINEVLNNFSFDDLKINFYRVLDNLYCNIAGVRNLGYELTKTPYMLILDMDTLMDKNMAIQLFKLANVNIHNMYVFRFGRITKDPKHIKNNTIHPAVCLIRTHDYRRIGGCEEDLVGNYGYTDPCFWRRSIGKVRIINLLDIKLQYLDEGEADIERNSSHNLKIYQERIAKKNWSKSKIRFKWVKLDLGK